MAAGETSAVIETPDEFYIMRVEEKQPEATRAFDEVRGEITEKLRREQEGCILGRWMASLRSKSHVRILDRDVFRAKDTP